MIYKSGGKKSRRAGLLAKVKFSPVVPQICERWNNQGDPRLKVWILLQYLFTENGIRSQVLGMGIGKDILWLIPRILSLHKCGLSNRSFTPALAWVQCC